MLRPTSVLTLAAALLGAPAPAAAQDEDFDPNDAAAYAAILYTPLGALPPMLAGPLTANAGGAARGGVAFHGAFGYVDLEGSASNRSYGLAVDVPVARTTLTISGGLLDVACDEDEVFGPPTEGFDGSCNSGFMGGARWVAPLVTFGNGNGANSTGAAPAFALGVEASFGVSSIEVLEYEFTDPAFPDFVDAGKLSANALAGGLGIPLALTARTGSITPAPYLIPRFAFGRLTAKSERDAPDAPESDEETESGSRFMLGGGLGFQFTNFGIGLDVGFQYVFIEDSKTRIGVGVTYGPR